MTDIIHLAAERTARASSMDELWQRYIDAEAKAKRSLAIEDGIRAGKAWRAWVESFVERRA